MPQIELLDREGVERITGLSHGYIVKLSKLNDFPKPFQGTPENMYLKSDIVEWTEARAAARAAPGEVRRIVRVAVDGSVRHSTR